MVKNIPVEYMEIDFYSMLLEAESLEKSATNPLLQTAASLLVNGVNSRVEKAQIQALLLNFHSLFEAEQGSQLCSTDNGSEENKAITGVEPFLQELFDAVSNPLVNQASVLINDIEIITNKVLIKLTPISISEYLNIDVGINKLIHAIRLTADALEDLDDAASPSDVKQVVVTNLLSHYMPERFTEKDYAEINTPAQIQSITQRLADVRKPENRGQANTQTFALGTPDQLDKLLEDIRTNKYVKNVKAYISYIDIKIASDAFLNENEKEVVGKKVSRLLWQFVRQSDKLFMLNSGRIAVLSTHHKSNKFKAHTISEERLLNILNYYRNIRLAGQFVGVDFRISNQEIG